jgi:hypothetical protein
VRGALAGWTGSCEVGMLPGGEEERVDADHRGRVGVAWRVVEESERLGLGGDGADLFGG